MRETIRIVVLGDTREKMVKMAREEIDQALSMLEPPFEDLNDQIKLSAFAHGSKRIRLTYEIWRDVRSSSKADKEDGISVKTGPAR